MKDHGDLRKVGRGRRDQRVRRAALIEARLQPDDWRTTRASREELADAIREARIERNWRIKRLPDGQVIALEPGREYENIFTGGDDPFMQAIEYAAGELRKENSHDCADAQPA